MVSMIFTEDCQHRCRVMSGHCFKKTAL